ncbi:MAG: Chromosome segregation protein SMC [Candidatus Moranbacteria bacterium GW2011_GWC1_45_18]|nr:MAG: Chromosome partition protein Smc [Candidatus Moranbacteria bacterium GW2011_GWC2_40_12]KKT33923.1 MAG: Chromosome partition protein Smc [Candidatus Moranbacteria bacterium GW2011_GWF2_44_10]KKT99822.1 MAG: Chromosome segregation protein SMC [Candidatus Moranbacteria bacterium GW2011_GWC1_45_18]HBB36928.1 hypothetical protein [Candidatus Moranbacteria bacterium]HBU25059.1 hypothetical protein [Candidatus Moranbacteria bacterium]
MYLKRIELTGFKSFATKTVLDFLPSCNIAENGKACGVTAIVGPNGSGKSNVADAVKWAMGEQSLKNIRGKKSEDVIFAGSGKKAQLGSAKVSLFFDNSDKQIPIEFEEVIISRKVYRSGEGEYFINNSKVRLIDIADLLAKAGIGQRSYCIINQGMADSVLNASPVERRVILEEAAGVKPYQLKKDRSARKLESTRQNLARVADLIKEIAPHLRVLKRQSEKAKRGEGVSRELKEKQNFYFGFLWHELQRNKLRILSEREEVSREEMKIQRLLDDLEIKIKKEAKNDTAFDEKRARLENRRNEIFENINNIRQEAAMLGAKIEIEKEKAKNFEMIREIPVDMPYFRDEFKKFKDNYGQLEKKLAEVKEMAELQEIRNGFRVLGNEISRLYQEINEGKKKAGKDLPKKENVINLKTIGELEEKKKAANQKIEELGRAIEENRREIDNMIKADREARESYFRMESELREKQFEISRIREKLNEIRVEMAKIEVREEDMAKRMREDLNISDPNLIEKPKESEIFSDSDALEREINRLKIQAEQIGAIDPMIIEEFEETQKRYDFLTSQSEDLEKSMLTLKEVIKEMDDRIKESFEEAFKKVNSEFSKYFKIIFGGGGAELVKTKIEARRNIGDIEADKTEDENGKDEADEKEAEVEEDQPKELGIEIKACPPGKRISTLNMLSGGERALTSLALLFAIISNSPPPFTVLDEVEAALDEANSKRFSRILNELSSETQFILITHNRETMRQASVLYGVTMSADGVSKVLSVKLDQVDEKGEIK